MTGSRELDELRLDYEKLCKVLYEEKVAGGEIKARELLSDSAVYFRLNGRYVKTPTAEEKTSEMQRVMYSLHSMKVRFALVMYFNGKEKFCQ